MKNVGSTDSFIRVMIGIAFYVNILVLLPSLGAVGIIILFALGTLCMVTAWVEHCPAYGPMKVNTCSINAGSCSCSADTK